MQKKKTPKQMVAWIVLLQIGHSISLSNSTDKRCGGYKEKLYMYFYFYPIFPTDLSRWTNGRSPPAHIC